MKYVTWGLVVLVVFAVLALILFNEELIFWHTFSYMAAKIAGEGGIHPRLAEVLAVGYALAFAFSMTISLSPARRKRGLIAVALLTALYSGFMYAMTRDANYQPDGKAIAFLEEQANGTFIKTHRRRNRLTNEPNISVTPQNLRWTDGQPAQRVQVTPATIFFGLSDRALVYYARRGRQIDFFDRPGAHPQTRQRLVAVTPDVVDEALAVLPGGPGRSDSVIEVRSPKLVMISQRMELFDSNGKPLYWFDPTYEMFELYDAAGAHPQTGAPLVPLDRADAAVLRFAIREEMKRQPVDLRGGSLRQLRNYSRELTARTQTGS